MRPAGAVRRFLAPVGIVVNVLVLRHGIMNDIE
jgi:hypothetical protein